MKRIALTDDTGRWFNPQTAETFEEATWWNGNNHISHATGSQWEHQRLYRTKGGRWILNTWSQWQGSSEEYLEISDRDAAAWLVKNEHKPHKACAEEIAALEIV